ncbi:MAG: bifunctional diaminohydroxyphosphoribosylaminopyrimidine deaminase/5-amino-6-(5-phosphoribosylamino)uracil reductase RibD [Gammaproteobacteria bacterium]
MTIDSSEFSELDRAFMTRALEVAQKARFNASPNPAVGCVLVRDGVVVGEGCTQPPGGPHAEIVALNNCDDTHGTTAYTTLEPCAHYGRTGPCCDALIEAGVSRVVAALEDPFEQVRGEGFARLRAAGVEVVVGVLEDQARTLHAGFITRLETGRPWVTVKIAASLDGATALANGQSKWITCSKARADVHRMRACSDVVVTGAGTIVADDPMLTARVDSDWPLTQPRAVVLDSRFRSPAEAHVMQRDSLVYTLADVEVPADALFEHAVLPPDDVAGLSLSALLDDLGSRNVNDVMVEAGAQLSGGFIRAGLADRVVLYQAHKLMGSRSRGMVDLGELTRMDEVIDVELLDTHRLGECTKIVFGFGTKVSRPNE